MWKKSNGVKLLLYVPYKEKFTKAGCSNRIQPLITYFGVKFPLCVAIHTRGKYALLAHTARTIATCAARQIQRIAVLTKSGVAKLDWTE